MTLKKLSTITMIKTSLQLWIPVAVTMLLASGCQSAKDPFAVADADGSGKIAKPEFERFMLESIFSEADANGDSKVSYEEWKVINPDTEKEKFSKPDADKDGLVTPEEMKAYFAGKDTFGTLFEKIDVNGDKGLDREEVETFYKKAEQAAGSNSLQKISNAASE